jgi:hypothetical protein
VFHTERRRSPTTGRPCPWIVRRSAMVNNYYIYAVDRDFEPFFLKFCSYFPFNAKLCLNGHEYAKRQLAQKAIAFEVLDNGILSCADTGRLQRICEGLSAEKQDRSSLAPVTDIKKYQSPRLTVQLRTSHWKAFGVIFICP